MFSEFLSYLFCFFTILKAFPGDTLVPNKPDALCDEPINSEVRQPTNTGLFYVQRPLLGLLIIYMVHLFASPCIIQRRLLCLLIYILRIHSQGIKLQAFALLTVFVAVHSPVHALKRVAICNQLEVFAALHSPAHALISTDIA